MNDNGTKAPSIVITWDAENERPVVTIDGFKNPGFVMSLYSMAGQALQSHLQQMAHQQALAAQQGQMIANQIDPRKLRG